MANGKMKNELQDHLNVNSPLLKINRATALGINI